LEEHLITGGIKLADGETIPRGEPAKRIGEPEGQARQVVESEDMTIVSGNREVVLFALGAAPPDRGRTAGALSAKNRSGVIKAKYLLVLLISWLLTRSHD
jgi:hypothetical protein